MNGMSTIDERVSPSCRNGRSVGASTDGLEVPYDEPWCMCGGGFIRVRAWWGTDASERYGAERNVTVAANSGNVGYLAEPHCPPCDESGRWHS